MSKRWTPLEIKQIAKMYSDKKTYEEIGKKMNRSPNAIKLRIETVIYKNIVAGKSVKALAKLFNVSVNTIEQHYYSYKSFLESKGLPTKDIKLTDKDELIKKLKKENQMLKNMMKKYVKM